MNNAFQPFLPPLMSTFGALTTATEIITALADQVRGKNVLVTGTSVNGLGYETAKAIATYANLVIVTGYDAGRLQKTKELLVTEVPTANIRTLTLNLACLADVRTAAAEVNAYTEPIHVLINNAASSIGGFSLTVDGFERQIATDHLGPFLFTSLILPKILAAGTDTYTPRIVFVASGVHAWHDGVILEQVEHPDESKYAPMRGYSQAKSANILTTCELARRYKGRINAYSLTPGVIMTNFMASPEASDELFEYGVITKDGKPNPDFNLPWKTIAQGASTILFAAFDPTLNDKSGSYLRDCGVSMESVKEHSKDPVRSHDLWVLSERLVNTTFP